MLEPILNTAPAASKNNAGFKSGQNRLKNKQLASLIYIRDTLCRFKQAKFPDEGSI